MAGQYILQITPLNLVLKEMGTENPVAEWPIQHLRRYGRGRTKFSFEAGDKCKTGIGVYTFNTREGDQIFHVVDMHARKLSNQQQTGALERRLHLNSQSFKPLSETRRRAKSEGKLLESSNDSTINEISESMENVTNRFNPGDTPSLVPKNKLSLVDGVGNGATGDGPNDGEVVVRPRSKTDVPSVRDRMVGEEDDHSSLKSMESLLQNTSNSEFNSVETVKTQEEETEELKEDVNNIHVIEDSELKIKDDDLNNEQDNVENIMVDKSTVDHAKEGEPPSDSDNVEQHVVEKLELSPVEKSESPFEPLLTSEHAAQDIDVFDNDTTDFTVVSKEAEAREVVAEEKIVDDEAKRVGPELIPLKSFEADIVTLTTQRGEDEVPRKRKSRKAAHRNKSFEFGSSSEKAVDNKKHSGSFSSFDYRKYSEQTSKGGTDECFSLINHPA